MNFDKARKKFGFASFYGKFGVVTILGVVFVIAALLSPNFLKPANLTNVLRQIVVVTVIGCGATFVLITAQINIAYDSLIACIGCISCIVMAATQNVIFCSRYWYCIGCRDWIFLWVLCHYVYHARLYRGSCDQYHRKRSDFGDNKRPSHCQSGQILNHRTRIYRAYTHPRHHNAHRTDAVLYHSQQDLLRSSRICHRWKYFSS